MLHDVLPELSTTFTIFTVQSYRRSTVAYRAYYSPYIQPFMVYVGVNIRCIEPGVKINTDSLAKLTFRSLSAIQI